MKASIRWLRELCPELPDDASGLAERFTRAGLDVERVEPFGSASESCLIAEIISIRPHTSNATLQVVTVNAGRGPQDIVCGAPNVPGAGGLVVLAPLGTHLSAKGTTVGSRRFGDVVSDGMLCSEAELGLGEDASGLLQFPAGTAQPGASLAQALPASRDSILEISLTPNRPDGLGHIGLAREAAALFGVPFSGYGSLTDELANSPAGALADLDAAVSIVIEDPERCPQYGAALMVDVEVRASSFAARWRLQSLGVRAISNVVDITNLIMLEFGHPMHAFDLDKVRRQSVVVRRAKEAEHLRTLDGVDRSLFEDDLVICDGEGPVALAGIIGGGDSEITQTTKRVLLECAFFDPRTVRRSSRRHGIHTESSHRFERGVDWGDTRPVLARATALIAESSGGRPLGAPRVVVGKALGTPRVILRAERMEEVLGTSIDRTRASDILQRLGFSRVGGAPASPQREGSPSGDEWQVPSFRPDVLREIDLIEEVGRCVGYDAVPTCLPRIRASRDAAPLQGLARSARVAAVGMGLSEAVTYAFVSPADLETIGAPRPAVRLSDPLSEEHSVMRSSLLPGLLHAVARARRHGEHNAALFSIGTLFLDPGLASPEHGAQIELQLSDDRQLPTERLAFASVVAGDRPDWLRNPPRRTDVWDAKGIAEGLVWRVLGRTANVLAIAESDRPQHLHPRGAGWIEVDGKKAGLLGVLHPNIGDTFEVGESLALVEIDLHVLHSLGARAIRYSALPRFPATVRDLAVVVDGEVPAGDVERLARETAADMAERVVLFDRFVGGSVPTGRASLAFHVVYRASDRTLTDAEVDACHSRVVEAIQSRFAATLRS